MDKERVIVVGVYDGKSFAKCLDYSTDKQLEKDVFGKYSCDDFMVFYDEDIEELEEALEDFYSDYEASLSIDDCRCIKDMVKSKEFDYKEIAANYGVSIETVKKICRGKNGRKA